MLNTKEMEVKINLNNFENAEYALNEAIVNWGIQHYLDLQLKSLVEDGIYEDYDEAMKEFLADTIFSVLDKLIVNN